jgi:hypothetical protein
MSCQIVSVHVDGVVFGAAPGGLIQCNCKLQHACGCDHFNAADYYLWVQTVQATSLKFISRCCGHHPNHRLGAFTADSSPALLKIALEVCR